MIRAATPADAAAITAIYNEQILLGTATAEEVELGEAEMAARMATVAAERLPWFVWDGGDVLGYAYARPYHSRAAYRWTVEDAVYVAADARGQGVGGALLSALVSACEAAGKRQMIASITAQGGDASVALHARAGFAEVGRFPAIIRKFGRWLDVVYMQRALGAGERAGV